MQLWNICCRLVALVSKGSQHGCVMATSGCRVRQQGSGFVVYYNNKELAPQGAPHPSRPYIAKLVGCCRLVAAGLATCTYLAFRLAGAPTEAIRPTQVSEKVSAQFTRCLPECSAPQLVLHLSSHSSSSASKQLTSMSEPSLPCRSSRWARRDTLSDQALFGPTSCQHRFTQALEVGAKMRHLLLGRMPCLCSWK